ncbi:MAG TPA: cobyrinate a,c-diamide synthase [Actinomycetes bacterium]|jgi:cobyrinic acid a,c-diamide synthase|nr:cobyrinate a,c-diamide synthase [Actinomycetes bacterium]
MVGEVMTARVVVAGTRSGVGKTTVATGLMAAFAERGRRVAGFKVGPDFIDPSYHALATGRAGRNLDAFLSGSELVAPLFAHGAAGADLAIVEGVMGMFDGAGGAGELASTAQVAKLLCAPVLLVVDCSAVARSVAAVVHGFSSFDRGVGVAGLVLNRVASDRHEDLLRQALDPLGVPIVGVLRRQPALATPERHLGLVPAAERRAAARRTVAELSAAIAQACDLPAVAAIAAAAPRLATTPWVPAAPRDPAAPWGPAGPQRDPVRIGVASAPAFTFLYQENLELLEAGGAELVPVDPTADESLPDRVAALYLGGGFPETYAEALAANQRLRAAVRRFAAHGRPVLAECGGLLYLTRTLDGHAMCGVLPADGRMTGRLRLGYRCAEAAVGSAVAGRGITVRGHEFHYSRVEPAAGSDPAWLLDGERPEGFVAGGVHASYLHTHWAAFPELPARLLEAARRRAVA